MVNFLPGRGCAIIEAMHELVKQLEALAAKVDVAMAKLNLPGDQATIAELEAKAQAPDFWQTTEAPSISKQLSQLKDHVAGWTKLAADIAETLELAKLGDPAMQPEIEADYRRLAQDYAGREAELKLSGPYDQSGAIIQLFAGTGGTDAQDWAAMLERMYLRWAEKHGYQATILEESAGEEAGIKSATLEINGRLVYGLLKSEQGVHRLVRLSPFNADNLRQTSFALVEVVPQLERTDIVELDPKDLRIDVYRSGGKGGQSVNTTDSAVRVTHLPTGLVVAIQNERSQLQNKEKALTVLKARLAKLMAEQHQQTISQLRAQAAPSWGNQIRSYVLHPYTKVKDHRTGFETASAQAVLDGELDPFIEAYLQSQIGR